MTAEGSRTTESQLREVPVGIGSWAGYGLLAAGSIIAIAAAVLVAWPVLSIAVAIVAGLALLAGGVLIFLGSRRRKASGKTEVGRTGEEEPSPWAAIVPPRA